MKYFNFTKIFLLFFILLTNIKAASIFKEFSMPPLIRIPDNVSEKIIQQSSLLYKRLQNIPVSFSKIEDLNSIDLLNNYFDTIEKPLYNNFKNINFKGDTTSKLNKLLNKSNYSNKKIFIKSSIVYVDEPVILKKNILISGNSTVFINKYDNISSAFILKNSNNITFKNLIFKNLKLGILVIDSRNIFFDNLKFLYGNTGISIVKNSNKIFMNKLTLLELNGPGILIQGNSSLIRVRNSVFKNIKRAENAGAGLLITDGEWENSKPLTNNTLDTPIYPFLQAPHFILIEKNYFTHNRAQGIYCDGGYANVIKENVFENNDKEGICLDWGSARNWLIENVFIRNGFRARQTDHDLKVDFVLKFGRMADGSAVAKLPGISIDNGAENIIAWNIVRDNAGDGIKLVRSSFRNVILFNSITNNNRGGNSRFQFAGILIGYAKSEVPSSSETPLDFLPSNENIIAGNIIDGKHFFGVVIDKKCCYNDIYDNMVRHYLNAAFGLASKKINGITGNSWQFENSLNKRNKTNILKRIKKFFKSFL